MKLNRPFILQSIVIHFVVIGSIAMIGFKNATHTEDLPVALQSAGVASRPVSKLIPDGVPSERKTDEGVAASTSSGAAADLSPAEMQNYLAEVVNRLQRIKQYPKDAIVNEQEGVVELILEVRADGNVVGSQLTKPSPYESLNRAAVAAVQKLGTLPPVPSGMAVQIRVPLHFELK